MVKRMTRRFALALDLVDDAKLIAERGSKWSEFSVSPIMRIVKLRG
jgi:hypothetical protein